jgi:hypothetical protein
MFVFGIKLTGNYLKNINFLLIKVSLWKIYLTWYTKDSNKQINHLSYNHNRLTYAGYFLYINSVLLTW